MWKTSKVLQEKEKAKKIATTFRALANLRLELDNNIGAATKEQYRQAFNANVSEAIGHLPANEMTARILGDVRRQEPTVTAQHQSKSN